ncbi:NACHT domain-containing protein [Phaeacidiphilus oryzae]|uniref:hypothetical protein n=1 Tax=Phaeacidiphilus oryzae TaxID=348818 RepID=UPI00055E4A15|nr:hypothetical protein [Phaeacidiphilus oryzae]
MARHLRTGLLVGLGVFGGWVSLVFLRDSQGSQEFMGYAGFVVSAGALGVALLELPRRGVPTDAARPAEELANEVRQQWEEEARVRGLFEPEAGTLPLSWTASARGLRDSRPARLASVAGGERYSLPARGGISGDARCAARELAEQYRRVPGGRLVVLGEPGAGKTVLALLLVLGLLGEPGGREPGPVPVLLAAARWDPVCESLDDWLLDSIARHYYGGRRDVARRLLAAGLVLPVLDGLDEVSEVARRSAIERINSALCADGDRPIVVTCRSLEYGDLIAAGSPVLRRASVVEVDRLTAEEVADHLLPRGAGWLTIRQALLADRDGPLAEALSTPLMVGLLVRVCGRLDGAVAADSADAAEGVAEGAEGAEGAAAAVGGQGPGGTAGSAAAAELLAAARESRTAVENHLLDAFVRMAFEEPAASGAAAGRRWPADRAERWLTYLATYLHAHRERELAWWRLAPRLLSPWVAPVLALVGGGGLACAMAAWIAWLDPGMSQAPSVGGGVLFAVLALVVWLAVPAPEPRRTVPSLHGGAGRLRRGFLRGAGLVALIAVPVVVGQLVVDAMSPGGWTEEPMDALGTLLGGGAGVASAFGLALAVEQWLQVEPSQARKAAVLDSVRQDRRSSLGSTLCTGLVVGLLGLPGCAAGMGLGRAVFQALTGGSGFPGGWAPFRVVRWCWDVLLERLPGAEQPIPAARSGFLVPVAQYALLPGAVTAALVLLSQAWPRCVVVRWFLAARGRLPWRLLSFLEDARARGLLRQAGGVYQFRHVALQERLAGRPGRGDRHAAAESPAEPSAESPGGAARRRTRRSVLAGAGVGAVAVLAPVLLREAERSGDAAFAVQADRLGAWAVAPDRPWIARVQRRAAPDPRCDVELLRLGEEDWRTVLARDVVAGIGEIRVGAGGAYTVWTADTGVLYRHDPASGEVRWLPVESGCALAPDGSSAVLLGADGRPFRLDLRAGLRGGRAGLGPGLGLGPGTGPRTGPGTGTGTVVGRNPARGFSAPGTVLLPTVDGRYCAVVEDGGPCAVWALEGEGTPVRLGGMPGVGSGGELLGLRADGRVLAYLAGSGAAAPRRCVLWSVADGRETGGFPSGDAAPAVSADGRVLAAYDQDRERWAVRSGSGGRLLAEVGDFGAEDTLYLNPTGTVLLGPGPADTVLLWDVRPGAVRRLRHPLGGDTGALAAANFSLDGRWAATHDGLMLRVWRGGSPRG